MKTKTSRSISQVGLGTAACLLAVSLVPASWAETLTLDAYLGQVQAGNAAYKAANHGRQGALSRSREGESLVEFIAFGSAQTVSDSKQSDFLSYSKLKTNSFQLGVSKLWTFGLQSKIAYNLGYTEYVGFRSGYYEGRPGLELTQSLWRNFFGEETRAQQVQLREAALATSYAEGFKAQIALAEAESSYWRLTLARESAKVSKEALDRALKLKDWASRRVRLQLADQSDLLQAEAAWQLRKLQLVGSENEIKSAARAFNLARGLEGSEVPETLSPPDVLLAKTRELPATPSTRMDVQAAYAQARAAGANARVGRSRNSPTLEAYGSYAWNSRASESSSAFTDSFHSDRPTSVIGIRFSAPINFTTPAAAREGYAREELAAELTATRKDLEQKQDWENLQTIYSEARERAQLALELEQVQDRKLKTERDRLSRGRSTTYQVLTFEQDFSQAQLARIEAQAALLRIAAQFRLYRGDVQ